MRVIVYIIIRIGHAHILLVHLYPIEYVQT